MTREPPIRQGAGRGHIAAARDTEIAPAAFPLALTEVHHVAGVRAGREAADTIVRTIAAPAKAMRIALADTTPELLAASLSVSARFQDLDLDLVDAVNVVLAAEYDTEAVLTLDRRDFRALRPLTSHQAFRVLPDDL
ncbi:VapC toxin family PIN domain ribonuclease [Streptomyces sp. SYSU K21746]